MKPFAEKFYKSREWQKCRRDYIRAAGGLCEVCLNEGRVTAGVIVHHINHVTPETITDPNVLLNWDNLQLVCRNCHAKLHSAEKRYTVDELGRISPHD